MALIAFKEQQLEDALLTRHLTRWHMVSLHFHPDTCSFVPSAIKRHNATAPTVVNFQSWSIKGCFVLSTLHLTVAGKFSLDRVKINEWLRFSCLFPHTHLLSDLYLSAFSHLQFLWHRYNTSNALCHMLCCNSAPVCVLVQCLIWTSLFALSDVSIVQSCFRMTFCPLVSPPQTVLQYTVSYLLSVWMDVVSKSFL